MAFNLTGSNVELYIGLNTAINAAIASLMISPSFGLCLLCIVALMFAKDVVLPMRVLIINILAAEMVLWIALAFLVLGFIPRLFIAGEGNITCRISLSLVLISYTLKNSAVALYAINVYIFIRYGIKKVKWCLIITFVVVSLIVSVAIGILPFISQLEIVVNNGFCDINPKALLFRVGAISAAIASMILLSIIIVFSLFTYCYVRKNVLEDNVEIKRAVAKNLYYFTISSVFTVIYVVAPPSSAGIKAALEGQSIVVFIIINYFFQLLFILPSVASPIAAIIILKPLRLSMKQGFEKCCVFFHRGIPAEDSP
jgi:hypothetical protein